MGCPGGHIQFFRVRAPVPIDRGGARPRGHWLFESVKLLDFSWNVLIQETFFVGRLSNGAITLSDLSAMPWPDYDSAVHTAVEINKRRAENAAE